MLEMLEGAKRTDTIYRSESNHIVKDFMLIRGALRVRVKRDTERCELSYIGLNLKIEEACTICQDDSYHCWV